MAAGPFALRSAIVEVNQTVVMYLSLQALLRQSLAPVAPLHLPLATARAEA